MLNFKFDLKIQFGNCKGFHEVTTDKIFPLELSF